MHSANGSTHPRVVITGAGFGGLAARHVRQLGYDYLIVASGAVDSYFGHDQWAAHSYPMKTLTQAVALRDQILSAYERAAWSATSTPSGTGSASPWWARGRPA
jgi:NADH dehydrogenase FAD-containing subunit